MERCRVQRIKARDAGLHVTNVHTFTNCILDYDKGLSRTMRQQILEFVLHFRTCLGDVNVMSEYVLRWLETTDSWAWFFFAQQPFEMALTQHMRTASESWFRLIETLIEVTLLHESEEDPELRFPSLSRITLGLDWTHLVAHAACRPRLLSIATLLAKHDPQNIHVVLLHNEVFLNTLATHTDLQAVVTFLQTLPPKLGMTAAIRPILEACLHAVPTQSGILFFLEQCVRGRYFHICFFLYEAIRYASMGKGKLLTVLLEVHPYNMTPLILIAQDEKLLEEILTKADEALLQRLRDAWPGLFGKEALPIEQEASARFPGTRPITLQTPRYPVVASDGRVYERNAILRHMSTHGLWSPLTRQPLEPLLYPFFV